jgi:hypothetical protein
MRKALIAAGGVAILGTVALSVQGARRDVPAAGRSNGRTRSEVRANPFDDGSASTSDDGRPETRQTRISHADAGAAATTFPASAVPPTGASCDDGKRTCRDMVDCADARYHLNQCGMARLDGDGDGTPCESICRGK